MEILILLSTFLLDLPSSKDHVCGASCCSKSTLTFWDYVVLAHVFTETIEQHTLQYFANN